MNVSSALISGVDLVTKAEALTVHLGSQKGSQTSQHFPPPQINSGNTNSQKEMNSLHQAIFTHCSIDSGTMDEAAFVEPGRKGFWQAVPG